MNSQALNIQEAFKQYNQEVTISNFKVACLLGMVLVPSFTVIDHAVYPKLASEFLVARLECSVLIGLFLAFLLTGIGRQYYGFLGVILLLLPSTCISYMIYRTEGAESPYYAGLNLVLLVLGFVLRWNFCESLIAVSLVGLEYLGACWMHARFELQGIVINNFYFFVSTSIIVATGNYLFSQLRFREFALRYELNQNRKELEESLVQLKENEVQLVHSEKLASLGRMSAGMIHEINNPLNFAITGLFTLRKKSKYLPPDEQKDYAEILKDVEEGVGRVKTIVSDLRVFTRPDAENSDEVSVKDVVTAALRFLNFELKDEVRVEQHLSPDLKIWANKNKLIHILANLLQNSLDALRTKTFTDEKPAICITGREENEVSILTVHDNGPGIAAAHLQKIFDPFFTTKNVGAGMGLGLSICYRLVEEAQGKISVKTEVGKFCEFTLKFPVHNKQMAAN